MEFLPPPKRGCHRTGFTKKCGALVKSGVCERWVQVRGVAMDGTETVNRWACTDDHELWALIELGRQMVGTIASIDKFRGEMAEANAQATALRDPDLIDMLTNGRRHLPPPSNNG